MSEPGTAARPKLLWTLLGAIILVSIFPLLISNYFSIRINRDSLETLEKKYLTRSAVGIATDIENLTDSYEQQLKKIAGGISSSALVAVGSDPFQGPAPAELIQNYTSADPDLLALRIINRAGQGSEAQPAGLGPQIVSELNSALGEALKGQTYVGKFQYLDALNQPAVILAVPVINSQQGTLGAVEALVSLRRIKQRLQEEGKGDLTAFVVDRSGRVLLHSEAAITIQHPDYSGLKIVQEFMKGPVRITESYKDTTSPSGVQMLGTVAPVSGTSWGVVVQKQESRAFASVQKMITGTMAWGAIALVLAILVGTLFAHRISKPIRLLAAKSREIAAGNYQQRVSVKTRNEIGLLADNFNVMSGEIEKSIEQLKKAANENQLLFINSVRMLAAAIDAKDPYTRGHSERVARYSIAIGKHLQLPADQMRNLRISALLHDVGKIGIDDRILRKPGALSDEEFEVMKGHPDKGAAIMGGVAQLIDIIPGMKYHHEKWGGGGYPDNLKGEDIPMQARIVAIADTFDAMTTNRPYQKAMELQYVVEKISSFGGSRFDPRVVQAFANAVKTGDIQVEEQVRGAA